MRKTYIVPEIEVVEIQTAAGMLAQSSFDLKKSTTVDGSSALSRESDVSFWDDDEEEN